MYILKKCIYDTRNTEKLFTMYNLKLKNYCLYKFKIMCNIHYKYILKLKKPSNIIVCFKLLLFEQFFSKLISAVFNK